MATSDEKWTGGIRNNSGTSSQVWEEICFQISGITRNQNQNLK